MRFVQPIRDKEQLNEMQLYLKEKNERDYIMFMIGINTGLRVSDILSLRVKDVKETTHIKIQEKKTGKYKRVIINPPLRKSLNEYIIGKNDRDFLIMSRQKEKNGKSKPIDRSTAYRILNEAALAIGFRDNVGTHTMRKTFGYFYFQKYGDVGSLQKLFNHDKQTTTLRYIGVEQDYLDKNITYLY